MGLGTGTATVGDPCGRLPAQQLRPRTHMPALYYPLLPIVVPMGG